MFSSKPLIGIPACTKHMDDSIYHSVAEKYLSAVLDFMDCYPIIIPAFGNEAVHLLPLLHGMLITGSISNIEPHHYGQQEIEASVRDPKRDKTNLNLIKGILAHGIPMLAICRGHQELNVALGGSLLQKVHHTEGKMDHREKHDQDLENRYSPAHPIQLYRDGILYQWLQQDEIMVNSLHEQGIDRLADRLSIEAVAEDGLIEAVSVKGAVSMALGVQWHPEWNIQNNPVSKVIFERFKIAAYEKFYHTRTLP